MNKKFVYQVGNNKKLNLYIEYFIKNLSCLYTSLSTYIVQYFKNKNLSFELLKDSRRGFF